MPIEIILGTAVVLSVALFAYAWKKSGGGKKGRSRDSSESASAEYCRGLNFILSEQPDRALEVFLRLVEVNKDSVETHFALANLFRKRGEVDRAIRIHENINARPNLPNDHRQQALYELAIDYTRAGLFDRSEKLFKDLRNSPTYQKRALLELAKVYEQEREWESALTARIELAGLGDKKQAKTNCHYYCELTELAFAEDRLQDAKGFIKKAFSQDKSSPRAALLQAEYALRLGDSKAALKKFHKLITLKPDMMFEALPRVARMLGADSSEFLDFCSTYANDDEEQNLFLAFAAIVYGYQNEAVVRAVQFCLARNERLARFLHKLTEEDCGGESGAEKVFHALHSLSQGQPFFRCHECGYRSRTRYWFCPSCRTWDSYEANGSFSIAFK